MVDPATLPLSWGGGWWTPPTLVFQAGPPYPKTLGHPNGELFSREIVQGGASRISPAHEGTCRTCIRTHVSGVALEMASGGPPSGFANIQGNAFDRPIGAEKPPMITCHNVDVQAVRRVREKHLIV